MIFIVFFVNINIGKDGPLFEPKFYAYFSYLSQLRTSKRSQ